MHIRSQQGISLFGIDTMAERFRQITYGQELDGWEREIARLREVVKRLPQRSHEIDQIIAIRAAIVEQMRREGKRRSSSFRGLERQP